MRKASVWYTSPIGQQGGNALFQQPDRALPPRRCRTLPRGLPTLGLQIGCQQPLCPALGAGIPQEVRRHRLAGGVTRSSPYRKTGYASVTVSRPVGIQIKLHHRFQRDLVQQQAVGVHDVDPVAQLRQHIAAKGGGIRAGKEQTACPPKVSSTGSTRRAFRPAASARGWSSPSR